MIINTDLYILHFHLDSQITNGYDNKLKAPNILRTSYQYIIALYYLFYVYCSSIYAHIHTQNAPGATVAVGYNIENSIPLSIFPIATDKFCICFCGLPGRGKTHISRRLAKYLTFFHAVHVELFNVSEYRRNLCGAMKVGNSCNSNSNDRSRNNS